MTLPEFIAGIRVEAGAVRFAAPALDTYFAAILPGTVRAAPGRCAFAAAGHAALLMLRRHLVTEGIALGLPGPDDAALRAAGTGLHPGLSLAIGTIPEAQHGRALRVLLVEGDGPPGLPPGVVWPSDRWGTGLVALLPPGGRWPDEGRWAGLGYRDAEGFTLAFRA